MNVDGEKLRRALETRTKSEVRFDEITRALYSTDASVYQIQPIGVVIPRSQNDVIEIIRICVEMGCPITMRGGGTSQAGQAIGEGLQVDLSKYVNRLIEVNAAERWAVVEPGIVLDELNAQLKAHGLRFAPDISTASRATIGGMMANNSAGARSVLYGKTIDHVMEQKVILSDGSMVHFRPLTPPELEAKCAEQTLEGECYRTVRRLGVECAEEVERRYPKVLRRVGGYNLDEFVKPDRAFDMTRMMVGSEGTLGVVLEAKVKLVPLPKHKSVLTIEFDDLLDALGATPVILKHGPSAIEVMDKFILDHTKQNPAFESIRRVFLQGDPGALLCVEFYAEQAEDLRPRMEAAERDVLAAGYKAKFFHAMELATQARIWSLREASLGLSMAMKGDAKSASFVEDTAVAPERLREYIDRFLKMIRAHGTDAGVYAHASVGCLHVRPVVNLKTADGVKKFESIATESAKLVLEFGGALSGEHGDGYVRSPFMRQMFGDQLYEAFREIKRTFDPQAILNPGKIVDSPPLTANLRFGPGYQTANAFTYFDYSEHGGMSGAVEMCSGVGACRKKLEGTMCPSYMATRDEMHSTRGRANALRMLMAGKADGEGVKETLDLCLECRACKSECPVGVDVARFKSEFLADYYSQHGTPLEAKVLGNAERLAKIGSALAPVSNWVVHSLPARWINEQLVGMDSRRLLPRWTGKTLRARRRSQPANAEAHLFVDTFTNYYDPEIGEAALHVLTAAGVPCALAPNVCCGRPLISQGLLADARKQAERNTELLHALALRGEPILFCEPSCLSAMKEDAPALLRGEERERALAVARQCFLWEEYVEERCADRLQLRPWPDEILLHGHCHQKSMGLLPKTKSLLLRIPGAKINELDAGCCGMAGSFGYMKRRYDVSRAIGERKLLPAARAMRSDQVLVASGTSCRHQVEDFAQRKAVHPAVLLARLLPS
ncbi:MAG: FAD-binding protein [Candidatus Solibacter usitatus]|nr:FAD-binding protein [Candidatus Solibacter usitatus]